MTLAQAYKKQFGKVSYPYKIYDANGNVTYFEYNSGYWMKREYDTNGNQTYFENSNGFWEKYEFNANGNVIHREDSDGHWAKYEYNANGNETYYEDSKGRIIGNKETIEIDGVKYSANQVREWVAGLKPMADK